MSHVHDIVAKVSRGSARTVRVGAIVAAGALLAPLVTAPPAMAAAVSVCPTGETASVHSSGDAADDTAIWIHPSDPARSTVIGTDKTATGGLNVFDLSGNELSFNGDGRLNNDDVRYNFPLGTNHVSLVGATNRVTQSLDFYKVNSADRSLTRAGSVHLASGTKITTPRGFAFYHSAVSGKYYAFVTNSGHTEQYELDGSTGQVTGTRVRILQDTPNPESEGLVADDELGRVYLAEEDNGGIWRFGAEPTDPTIGVKVATTTAEVGGHIVPDTKGLTMYFATGGRGYLIAVSQGGSSFHVYNRGDNAWVGEFKVGACNGIDAVTGIDGADITNFNLGPAYPQGLFVTQDHVNDTGNQNHKLIPWQNIANAFNPPLIIDTTWDPRQIGASLGGPDTMVDSGPSGLVSSAGASFGFSSATAGATFGCSLDGAAFGQCTSPKAYPGLGDGVHTFQVRATDPAGVTDPTPAGRTWTIDTTVPQVTSTVPGDAATNVAIDATIRATFSELIDPATVTGSTITLTQTSGGAALPAAVTYDAATRTATLDPGSDLATSTGYTVTVTTAVKDTAGNPLAAPATSTFTTSAAPPPPPPPSGAITRQTTSTVINTSTTSKVTVPTPTGTSTGDLLVACLTTNGGSVAKSGVPTGWQPIAAVTGISNPRVFGYYKVATAGEPSTYAWTLTTAVANGAGIARYSGVDTTNPLASTTTTATGAAATSGTLPSLTTTTNDAMLVGCMGINTSSTSVAISSPAGMTEAWDIGGKRHELADGIQPTAGPSGTKTWTLKAARAWGGWLTALRPE